MNYSKCGSCQLGSLGDREKKARAVYPDSRLVRVVGGVGAFQFARSADIACPAGQVMNADGTCVILMDPLDVTGNPGHTGIGLGALVALGVLGVIVFSK